MTSVFLLRLNKIDEQRTRWADYNDDYLEYHFLNQKTEMHYFQEKKKNTFKLWTLWQYFITVDLLREEHDLPKFFAQKNVNFWILFRFWSFPLT